MVPRATYLAGVVLYRRAGERELEVGLQRPGGRRALGGGVLEALGLVEHQRREADGGEALRVAREEAIADHEHIAWAEAGEGLVAVFDIDVQCKS